MAPAELTLSCSRPFDGAALLDFFRARAVAGVERPTVDGFERVIDVGDTPSVIGLRFEVDSVVARMPSGGSTDDVVEVCRRVLNLDAPPDLYEVLAADPTLAPVVEERPGLRVPGAFGGFEIALRAVIGQQVSVKGARTLAGRLVHSYGRHLDNGDDELTYLFPVPEVIADADLAEIGMPEARRMAIRGLARAVAEGRVDLSPDAHPAEIHARLVELPGIGEWTASYICMRALGDTDAFLPGDLGVLRGAAALGLPTGKKALVEHSRRWKPFRAYAVMYLWTAAG